MREKNFLCICTPNNLSVDFTLREMENTLHSLSVSGRYIVTFFQRLQYEKVKWE
jgi:hypothetical protein